jgi:hypothetical protein
MAIEGEREFLVLGADAELRGRLTSLFEPGDQLVAQFNGRHINLVAGHAESWQPYEAATLNMRPGKGQWIDRLAAAPI